MNIGPIASNSIVPKIINAIVINQHNSIIAIRHQYPIKLKLTRNLTRAREIEAKAFFSFSIIVFILVQILLLIFMK